MTVLTDPQKRGKIFRAAASAGALVGILALVAAWARPYYNWDLLGYLGVVYSLEDLTLEEIHSRTYDEVALVVSEERYRELTESSDYRSVTANDPTAFAQQLPFYRIKPAYTALISLLGRTGMDGARATVVIGRFSYMAIGLLIFFWLCIRVGPAVAVPLSAVMMAIPPMLDLAKLSTPDGLSTVFILGSLFLIVEKNRPLGGLWLLVVSILFRPDNVLWVLAASVFVAARWPTRRVASLVTASAAILVTIGIMNWAGSYGWITFFYINFVERLPMPADFDYAIGLSEYLRIYLGQAHPSNLPTHLALFALLTGWLFVVRVRHLGWTDRWSQVLLMSSSFMITHWFIYPAEERFFVASYLLTLLCFVQTVLDRRWSERSASA